MTTVYELTSNEFFYFVSNVVVNYHFDFFDPDDIKYVRLNDTNYVKVKHRNNKKWFIITMNGIIEYFEFKRKVGVSKAEKVINRQLFFTLNNEKKYMNDVKIFLFDEVFNDLTNF